MISRRAAIESVITTKDVSRRVIWRGDAEEMKTSKAGPIT